MNTRILKFTYKSSKDVERYIADIKFCGATVLEKVVLLSNKAVYITVKEPEGNSFTRRFKDTRSGNFLLN